MTASRTSSVTHGSVTFCQQEWQEGVNIWSRMLDSMHSDEGGKCTDESFVSRRIGLQCG